MIFSGYKCETQNNTKTNTNIKDFFSATACKVIPCLDDTIFQNQNNYHFASALVSSSKNLCLF